MVEKYLRKFARKDIKMKKILTLLVLGLFIAGYSAPAFAQTTDTTSRRQPPKFENGTPPNYNSNGENATGQFDGRRPKYKPDSQPGGKMEPKKWANSSDRNSKNGQTKQMKDGLKNGLKDGLKNGLKNGQVNGAKKSQ